MAATSRRARTYKEKSSSFTFGHFALPVAAVIAVGLLFVGIKLFFLTPPDKIGIEVIHSEASERPQGAETQITPPQKPAVQEETGTLTSLGTVAPEAVATGQSVILAGPIAPNGKAARVPYVPPSGSTATRSDSAKGKDSKTPTAQTNATKSQRNTQRASQATNGKWAVQIGAFVKQEGASTLLSAVKKQGYVASISRVDSSGKTFHRVRVDAGNSKENAAKLATELEKKGYPVAVVPVP
ncbi:MAG: SPOR domain-containing protein [Synergistaceae bacterium]|jgi:cell division septation protein DedD|nr:SPOR domain-containing protein [Synergistaceae bacterium]